MLARLFRRFSPAAADSKTSAYQPVPTTEKQAVPVTKPATSNNRELVAPKVDKGAGLERWVPINVFFSLLGTLVFVGLGTKALFDRNVPGVTTTGWLYLVIGICAIDGLLFFFTLLLSARKWRKEINRNGQWYGYPDTWYHTHMAVAASAFVLSAWTLAAVYLYYHNYNGEDPYEWPTTLNIQQWDKPIAWYVVIGVTCMARLLLLTDKYFAVYRALATPGLVPIDSAARAAVADDE